MKKLTLDETWIQCLKMWRWIVRQSCPRHVGSLKRRYILKNDLDTSIAADCFFCEYDDQRGGDGSCNHCPACKVDKNFHCKKYEYDYSRKPAAFLRKITELNKKRLAKRRKR